MRIVTLRAFSREAPAITETVLVLHGRRVIGQYTPVPVDIPTLNLETFMDTKQPVTPVAKEVQREAPKVNNRGKVSKGLGEIPGGVDPDMADAWSRSRPAPKK